MRLKIAVVAVLASLGTQLGFTQEAEAPTVDEALEAEIAYVQALVDSGYPDFADPIIKATKAKWPEADARFFAIEVRSLIAMGKMAEAEKKIASLPDRKGAKYWGARLELANNYSARNRMEECEKIYEEFFKAYASPTKDVLTFYLSACYAWGQILVNNNRLEEATKVYERLLKQKLPEASWCMMASETVDLYIHLGSDAKDKAKKDGFLVAASKMADKILQHPDQVIYFGRAVSMKAHAELLRGKVSVAQDIIEEFLPQLVELHDNIVAYDPDGAKGVRKMSPLPQCRYLLAEMLWKEAQEEYKNPKKDDAKVKDLLFGAKGADGKRNGMGAYNHAFNVFVGYPECAWAPKAGELADKIEDFANEKYKANLKKRVTKDMIERVLAEQFKAAHDLILSGKLEEGIKAYYDLLAEHPETENSLFAIETIIRAYHDLILQAKDEAKKAEWRLDCDAVEGYLAERFAGNADRALMTRAGDATLRMAALEKERGEPGREVELKTTFAKNYRQHANAAVTVAGLATAAQKENKYEDAVSYWRLLGEYYTNSTYYVSSFAQMSVCYGKLADRANEIAMMKLYVEKETNPVRRLQSQAALAQMYQKDGFDMLKKSAEIEDEAEINKLVTMGCASIVRGIKQFSDFAGKADTLIADPSIAPGDKQKYAELKETTIFLVGDCWSRMKKPEAKIESFRERAAEALEKYVEAYPKGKYATVAYVKLSMIYTALKKMEESKGALDRLTKAFPDSPEAKNAKPILAKSLIEMGMKKEGTEIYAEMLGTDGAYTAIQFANAGEALIEAKSWELANQAFEKAVRLAGTNYVSTVARARLGQAKSAFKQGSLVEAREALDIFLSDEKMSRMAIAAEANLLLAEVASEQGRTEKDDTLRAKDFGAAIGAVKKLRTYWSDKPQWEQDSIDLMSADIVIRRMNSEEAMGLKEQALETCGKAAAQLQFFLQSRSVKTAEDLEKLSEGERKNLERCYTTMIPLFSKMGAGQAERVIRFGEEYLALFPNGKACTEISNYMNRARAEGGEKTTEAAEPKTNEGETK